jgi:oxygen-dependent protoporphyrinogen oxidase
VIRHRKIFTTDNAIGLGALDRQTIGEYAATHFDTDTLNYLFSPIMRGPHFTSTKDHRAVQLLWTLRQMVNPLYTLSGGNGSLPVALAAQHEVRYRHAVERVEQTAGGVVVDYTTDRRRGSEGFDACVIATPACFSCALFPGMSGAQRRFFDAIRFTSAICVHFALSKRPDNPEMLLMFPECEDNDVASIYVNHNKAPGRAPMNKGSLSLYFTQEWSADKLGWPDDELSKLAIERMVPHYGALELLIEDAFVSRWPQFVMDPTPGLFSLMDEYQRSLLDTAPSRVQIAGDFLPCAGINQALASGASAAERIAGAVKLHN